MEVACSAQERLFIFYGLDSTGEKTLGLCCHPECISPEGVLDVETAVMDRELSGF